MAPSRTGCPASPVVRFGAGAAMQRLPCRSGFCSAFCAGRREVAGSGKSVGRTRNQEYRDWWTVFHDPVLNRLIEIAYNQNLTLVSAGTRVLEARAQLGVAIGEFYPQLQQGRGAVTYNRPSHADPSSTPQGVLGNFWRNSLGLTVNWELDFWGKFRRAIESADAAYLASIAGYDYVLATLLGDVATTYIGIRTLQTQIEIAARKHRQAEKGASHRRGQVPRRHGDQARRLSGARTCSARPSRRSPSSPTR